MFCLFNSKVEPTTCIYGPNDLTTPELVGEVTFPTNPKTMPFVVKKWAMRASDGNSRPGRAFISSANLVHLVNRLSPGQPAKWSVASQIVIDVNAGRDLNAYYDRRHVKFFVGSANGVTVATADSGEIVTHEVGHAILDAIRPDIWSVASAEMWAFHESFADISAICASLEYPWVVEYILKETEGDLTRPNVVCRIGEELASVFGMKELRCGTQRFNYVDPQRLPKNAPPDKLSSACHSFGRVFLGAWYACLVQEASRYEDKKKGLVECRDRLFRCLIKATQSSPRTFKFLESVSKLFVRAVRQEDAAMGDRIESTLISWNLIQPKIKMLTNRRIDDFNTAEYGVEQWGDCTILSRRRERLVPVSDLFGGLGMRAMSGNVPQDMKVVVADDEVLEFDGDFLSAQTVSNPTNAYLDAAHCVNRIAMTGDLGKGRMWESHKNVLRRNYIT